MSQLKEIINELSPALQKEVEDFALFLNKKYKSNKKYYLKQGWAGSLKEYKNQYTALELQKKALQWRSD
ncbi:DUF2281 domain-containing protein [candidate division KSB1 bacterium]|nr:DUF2281 domain-containing protein [candidate division KSB1 bacterium]